MARGLWLRRALARTGRGDGARALAADSSTIHILVVSGSKCVSILLAMHVHTSKVLVRDSRAPSLAPRGISRHARVRSVRIRNAGVRPPPLSGVLCV